MRTTLSIIMTMTWLTLACGGASGPAQPKLAPPLTLDQVDGSGTFSLEAQKGKVVLVDLWATWCAPCISELPHLQKLSESYDPKEFAMVGIVLESGDREEILDFIREKSITYPNLLGKDGTKESFGPFIGFPTKYLIDKKGYVLKRYMGVVGDQVLDDVAKLVRTGSLESES